MSGETRAMEAELNMQIISTVEKCIVCEGYHVFIKPERSDLPWKCKYCGVETKDFPKYRDIAHQGDQYAFTITKSHRNTDFLWVDNIPYV